MTILNGTIIVGVDISDEKMIFCYIPTTLPFLVKINLKCKNVLLSNRLMNAMEVDCKLC